MDLSSLSDAELDALIVKLSQPSASSAASSPDLSALSDAELDALAIQLGGDVSKPKPQEEQSFLSSVIEDVKGTPAALWGAIKSVPTGIKNVASIPYDVATGNTERLERTLKGAGKLALSTAGGIAGGTVGSVVPGAGTIAGASAGAAGGALMWDQLMESLGFDPATTPEEALSALRTNTVQGAVTAGATKALAPVARAVGSKLESTAKAMDRKSLGTRASDYGKAADTRTIDTPEGPTTKAAADLDALLTEGKLGKSRNPAAVLKKIDDATSELGAQVGKAIDDFDNVRTEPVRPQFDNALSYLDSGQVPADMVPAFLDRLAKIEEGILKEGQGSLRYIQNQKTAFGKSWDPADKVKSGFDRAIYKDLQQTIESKVPEVKVLNQEISKYRTAEPIVIRELKKSEATSPLSQLRDIAYTTGGIGAPTIAGSMLGGPAGAAIGALLGLAGKAIASPTGQATVARGIRSANRLAPSSDLLQALGAALTSSKGKENDDFASIFKSSKKKVTQTTESKEQPAAKPTPQPTPIDDATLDAVRQVESSGGKYLKSPAGAEGPYQFMPATAKAYGLKDPYDEIESRDAARRLLEDEFKALKDIKLALAAYNVGRPAVLMAIEKAGSKEFDEVAKFLPKETREYVPKVLEAKKKVLLA